MPTFPGAGERNRDYSGNNNHLTANGTLTDAPNPPIPWKLQSWAIPFFVASDNTLHLTTSASVATDTHPIALSNSGVSYVNVASASSGPGVTGLTVNVPSGTMNGDLMLAVCVVELASATVTAHADWGTAILNTPLSTRTHTQVVFAKFANNEPANYSFSWSSAECAAAIITYRNASAVSIKGGQANNSSVASVTAPTLTTPKANCLSVFFGSIMYGTTFAPPTSPGTYTERLDLRSSTASTNLALTIAEYLVPTGSATGTVVATATNADYNVGSQVILVPIVRICRGCTAGNKHQQRHPNRCFAGILPNCYPYPGYRHQYTSRQGYSPTNGFGCGRQQHQYTTIKSATPHYRQRHGRNGYICGCMGHYPQA